MFDYLLRMFRGEKATLAPEVVPAAEAAPRSFPLDVTDEDFAAAVLNADRLAVVDFWADWCAPCQIMSAYVGILAQTYHEQMVVAALDVDANPATPERYTILGLPTLIFFRGGTEIDRIVGVVSYEELRQRVEALLGGVEQVHKGQVHRGHRESTENTEDEE